MAHEKMREHFVNTYIRRDRSIRPPQLDAAGRQLVVATALGTSGKTSSPPPLPSRVIFRTRTMAPDIGMRISLPAFAALITTARSRGRTSTHRIALPRPDVCRSTGRINDRRDGSGSRSGGRPQPMRGKSRKAIPWPPMVSSANSMAEVRQVRRHRSVQSCGSPVNRSHYPCAVIGRHGAPFLRHALMPIGDRGGIPGIAPGASISQNSATRWFGLGLDGASPLAGRLAFLLHLAA